jgi:hypothetical protein
MDKLLMLRSVAIIALGWCISLSPVAADPHNTESTRVTPHMDVPIETGRNVVFCSTFHIAWNEMRNDIIGEDIRLEKPLEIVRQLNHGRMTKADIGEEDFLSMVGYGGKDIIGKINQALKVKFGDDAPVVDDVYNDDDIILAYAFLCKELQFEHVFEDFLNPIHFAANGRSTPVEGFGIFKYSQNHHRNLRDQVEIIDYKNMRDFIICLGSKHPDDEIILANVEPGRTLLETFEQVDRRTARSRSNGRTHSLNRNDVLQIPKLDVSMNHSYTSLLQLHLLNKGFEKYFIAEARQDLKFRLDECGATTKSEATLVLKKGPPPEFKLLRFNNPFLLYIKKKDAKYPYFAIWVENTELMVKSI